MCDSFQEFTQRCPKHFWYFFGLSEFDFALYLELDMFIRRRVMKWGVKENNLPGNKHNCSRSSKAGWALCFEQPHGHKTVSRGAGKATIWNKPQPIWESQVQPRLCRIWPGSLLISLGKLLPRMRGPIGVPGFLLGPSQAQAVGTWAVKCRWRISLFFCLSLSITLPFK